MAGINQTNSFESEEYDAAAIKAEFKSYQSILPKPDELLQQQHSAEILRGLIDRCAASNSSGNGKSTIAMPRFLKEEFEGGVKPHYALCSLLLTYSPQRQEERRESAPALFCSWLAWFVSCGLLHPQRNLPAGIITEQFHRVAHTVRTLPPADLEEPELLRNRIRDAGSPVPNFFLDPEDDRQFPPHIAMLVLLQHGEKESAHLGSLLNRVAWFTYAVVALVLRLVLEVVGGAGAIWGGSEVFGIRNQFNGEVNRWISIAVGVLCLLRFVILNAPLMEDEGDILGPAGPWSLRGPARLRAVFEHPFHYFVRARRPESYFDDVKKVA